MKRPYLPCRTDKNQQAIMDALRKLGYSVVSLHRAGEGVFDLLAARHGMNFLIEVKDCLKPPSGREFTPAQRKFNFYWTGSRCVVTCHADMMRFHEGANKILSQIKQAGISLNVIGSREAQYQPSLY